jgi:hypothetical protein
LATLHAFRGCFLALLAFLAIFIPIMAYNPYDLTEHPPRSPRCRLGGVVILPRLIDKARATVSNLQGEYTYGCSLDRYVLDFFEIDEKELLAEVAKGLGDGEIFSWIIARAKNKRSGQEIASFSAYHEQRTGGSPEKRERMSLYQSSTPAGGKRDDIFTWFDVLDLDDHQSFGGKV